MYLNPPNTGKHIVVRVLMMLTKTQFNILLVLGGSSSLGLHIGLKLSEDLGFWGPPFRAVLSTRGRATLSQRLSMAQSPCKFMEILGDWFRGKSMDLQKLSFL